MRFQAGRHAVYPADGASGCKHALLTLVCTARTAVPAGAVLIWGLGVAWTRGAGATQSAAKSLSRTRSKSFRGPYAPPRRISNFVAFKTPFIYCLR